MDEELKKQNQEIIEKFEKAREELEEKQKIVQRYKDELDSNIEEFKKEIANVDKILKAMERSHRNLEEEITKMKAKDEKDKSIFSQSTRESKSFLAGTSKEVKEELTDIKKQIKDNEETIAKIENSNTYGNSKFAKSILDRRIRDLKKKNVTMQSRQCKLADKIVADKLRKKLHPIVTHEEKIEKIVNKVHKDDEIKAKQADYEEKIQKLEEQNKAHKSDRELYDSLGGVTKVISTGLRFNEKLNELRINDLRNKQGRLTSPNKLLVVKNATASFIDRMKKNVGYFKGRVAAGFDAFKNYDASKLK